MSAAGDRLQPDRPRRRIPRPAVRPPQRGAARPARHDAPRRGVPEPHPRPDRARTLGPRRAAARRRAAAPLHGRGLRHRRRRANGPRSSAAGAPSPGRSSRSNDRVRDPDRHGLCRRADGAARRDGDRPGQRARPFAPLPREPRAPPLRRRPAEGAGSQGRSDPERDRRRARRGSSNIPIAAPTRSSTRSRRSAPCRSPSSSGRACNGAGIQTLMALGPVRLVLDASGAAALLVGDKTLSTGYALRTRWWHRVTASYDPATGAATVSSEPLPGIHADRPAASRGHLPASIAATGPLLFAAEMTAPGRTTRHFERQARGADAAFRRDRRALGFLRRDRHAADRGPLLARPAWNDGQRAEAGGDGDRAGTARCRTGSRIPRIMPRSISIPTTSTTRAGARASSSGFPRSCAAASTP